MSESRLLGALGVLALGVGLLLNLPDAAAQKKKPAASLPASSIGYVDLAKITEQLRETADWRKMVDKANNERTRLEGQLKGLEQIRYLTEPERKILAGLEAKPKVSAKDGRRIKALRSKSDNIDKEYTQLSQVEKPTPAQDERLLKLGTLRKNAIENLQNKRNVLQARLIEMQTKMLEEMQEQIVEKVTQVANAHDVTVVIDRQAILVGGQDLTDEVLKKLPKKLPK